MMINTLTNAFEEAIFDDNEALILDLLKDENAPKVLENHIKDMCETSDEHIIRKAFDIYISVLSPAKRYTVNLRDALFALQRNSKYELFFYFVNNFKGKAYNLDKQMLFFNSAMYGKIEIMEFYLEDPKINPADDKNALLRRLFEKTKVSRTGNNIQATMELLKKDKRVIEMAAANGQYDFLSSDIQEMFVF